MKLQFYKEGAIADTRLVSGVSVKSCGHYAHLDCFKAFVETLDVRSLGFSACSLSININKPRTQNL